MKMNKMTQLYDLGIEMGQFDHPTEVAEVYHALRPKEQQEFMRGVRTAQFIDDVAKSLDQRPVIEREVDITPYVSNTVEEIVQVVHTYDF
jgi:hypothetical protein